MLQTSKSDKVETKGGGYVHHREVTPEEFASKWGNKTKVITTTFLAVFTQLGGIMFLIGSLYLSYLEALNSAVIIDRPHQFEISLGLSVMAVMFSIIGFLFLTKWMTFKKLRTEFPNLQEAALKKAGVKGEKLFNIAMNIIDKWQFKSGIISIVFIIGNMVCTGLIVWATVAAILSKGGAIPASIWIYTLSISILAFFAGGCITMISPDEMDTRDLLNMAVSEYEKYAEMDTVVENIDSLGKPGF